MMGIGWCRVWQGMGVGNEQQKFSYAHLTNLTRSGLYLTPSENPLVPAPGLVACSPYQW